MSEPAAALDPATREPRRSRVNRELDHARRHGALREIVIPPCPERLVRLRRAISQPEPDLADVSRIAAGDVAMAATLIRNANGALHAVGPPVRTVGQAMDRLGLNHTAALMTGFLARHAIPVRHPRLARFWERATLRAGALAFIAGRLPGLSRDLAYTYGLFCHVGIPVLLQSVRGYGGTLAEAEARIDRPFVATENANHRTDHAVVGALVARAWELAPPLVVAIRLHHELDTLGAADIEPEIHTLVAAGLVAEHLMRRLEALGAEIEWRGHGARALDWLQVEADEVDDWHEAWQAALDAKPD